MIDIEELKQAEEEKKSKVDLKLHNKILLKEVKALTDKIEYYEQAKSIVPKPIKPVFKSGKGEATALMLWSDGHGEERITKQSTNGLNEFNPDIAKSRMLNFPINGLKLVNNHRNVVNIDNLVIGALGDFVHGFIHDEYVSTNYMTPIQATLFMQELIEAGLTYFLENGKFKRIVVVCKVGNHSRTTDKVYGQTELINSYEYFLYKYLENKFKGQIEFLIEENYFSYLDIYDYTISFEHGHAFKYAGGIGGIYPALMRHLSKSYSVKRFDLATMGHWHSTIHLPNALINGCVCGYNDYARRKGFSFEPPKQQFLLVNKEKGFTTNEPIFL